MKISPAWLVTAALIIYILWLTQCNKPKPCTSGNYTVDTAAIIEKYTTGWTKPKPDTIIRIKTVTRQIPGQPPAPVFVEVIRDREVPIILTAEDTMRILEDYFAKVPYTDSVKTKYGMIKIHDVISKNRIDSRRWDIDLATPVLTSRPWMIYIGAKGYTSPGQFIQAGELDLGYQNRKGQSIEASVLRTDRWLYGAGFKQVIFTSK
jgi:hypothetical protein